MTEIISQFFVNIFGDNAWLATLLIAIIPLIELKGAIPFGMSVSFWAENALSPWMSFLVAFCGSIIVVPFLALVFKPIVRWLDKYKFFHAIINFFTEGIKIKSQKLSEKVENKKRSLLSRMLVVFLFVAFPVPLTGVWTGTCFAILLGLNFWQSCIAVIAGNLTCGLIVTLICTLFPYATTIILYVFLGLMLFAFIFKLIIHIIKKRKNPQQ